MLAFFLEFTPEQDAQIFDAVPAQAAVFLLRGPNPQSEPYVSKTANLRRRLSRLLGAAPEEHTRRLNLRHAIRTIEYTPTGSDFESTFLLYKLLRSAFPKTYADRLRMRFAPLIKLHLDNEYPRATITTRLGKRNGKNLYYGPFPSRSSAEKFANDSLDFFKMRRCVDDLHPDPGFPGCVYYEMKMCLAPCFKGCTDQEYRAEVDRVQAYFDTRGESLLRDFSAQRDQASANLDFETAAAQHARLDKLNPLTTHLPEIIRRIDHLHGLIIQRAAAQDSVTLFRVMAGYICDPVNFLVQMSAEHASKSQSMESRLLETLACVRTENSHSTLETMEHLGILKRWYYRSSKVGEIFFADDKGTFPMRRIVRGIARVFRGEKPENAALQEPLSALAYQSQVAPGAKSDNS